MNRNHRYDAIRMMGDGDALDQFLQIAKVHQDTITQVLEICDRYPADFSFKRIAANARKCRTALLHELAAPRFCGPYGSHGDWGENGNAPRVRQMLIEAQWLENYRKETVQ